jgi:hypothetical protein
LALIEAINPSRSASQVAGQRERVFHSTIREKCSGWHTLLGSGDAVTCR